MTREAKIGMLTGLGVIIVIGVLLSNYLGDPAAQTKGNAPGPNQATGPMAKLPIAQDYRDQLTQPVAVPGMTNTAPDNTIPVAYALPDEAAQPAPAPVGPLVVAAVNPEITDVGPLVTDPRDTTPQTFMLPEPTPHAPVATTKPAPKSVIYTIASGDTLAKIAKKYYNSSKNSDVQKIVNANKSLLKDAGTTLVVGKPLTIPDIAPAQTTSTNSTPTPGTRIAPGTAKKDEKITIAPPSSVPTPGDLTPNPTPKPQTPTNAKTYTVQSGDTLDKIARKLAPTNPTAFVDKLKSANNIKDPRTLQVNQTLKVPV